MHENEKLEQNSDTEVHMFTHASSRNSFTYNRNSTTFYKEENITQPKLQLTFHTTVRKKKHFKARYKNVCYMHLGSKTSV